MPYGLPSEWIDPWMCLCRDVATERGKSMENADFEAAMEEVEERESFEAALMDGDKIENIREFFAKRRRGSVPKIWRLPDSPVNKMAAKLWKSDGDELETALSLPARVRVITMNPPTFRLSPRDSSSSSSSDGGAPEPMKEERSKVRFTTKFFPSKTLGRFNVFRNKSADSHFKITPSSPRPTKKEMGFNRFHLFEEPWPGSSKDHRRLAIPRRRRGSADDGDDDSDDSDDDDDHPSGGLRWTHSVF